MATSLTTKAGSSAGAKKGWQARMRGGMMKAGATLGSMHPLLSPKLKNKMRKDAGMKPLTPRKKPTRPAHVSKADWKKMDADDREMADLFVSKEITNKAMLGQGKSLSELVDDVRRALSSQLPKASGKDWSDCYIREIYSDKVILDTPTGNKLADYEVDDNMGYCLSPESEWQDVAQVWMPTTKAFQWEYTEKAGTSAGAKLGWQHRLAGRLGKVIGAWHGGVAGAGIGTAVAGPLGSILGFAGGARVGMKIGGRVGTRVSLGISRIKTGNKRIIAAGAKMLARGFKKSAEQKYGSTGRALKSGLSKLNAARKKKYRQTLTQLHSDLGNHLASSKETAMALTLKAGSSAGAKKGWLARMRGGAGKRFDRSLQQKYGTDRAGAKKAIDKATGQKVARGVGKLLGRTISSVPRGALKTVGKIRSGNKRAAMFAGRVAKGAGKLALRATKRNVQGIASFGRGVGEGIMGKSNDSFSVKQVGDNYRWFSVSSTAFIDKDRQIVTTAALQRDVELSETLKESQGDYGPLRFWHVGIPGGPGLDLGRCDFRLMIGRSLIESGTFVSKEIGQRAKELADELELSIGFRHPKSEPGQDGLFHNTLTLERSLLPSSKGSNLLTTFAVS